MCGILAYFGDSIHKKEFRAAIDLMNHRGPDYTGVLDLENGMLGHKRLSIIDLTPSSNQPFEINNFKMVLMVKYIIT